MITFLNIFSSLAVIIYSVIAYFQYKQQNKQHKTVLMIDQLNKQKEDFLQWFNDYLHLSQLYLRTDIKYNMDCLEESGASGDDKIRLQKQIDENDHQRIRYDFDFQRNLFNLVTDERRPWFQKTRAEVQKHYSGLVAANRDYTKEVRVELMKKMKENPAESRQIMEIGRQKSAAIRKAIIASNVELEKVVKSDIHEIEDRIEEVFKK